jgi:hypothetical protein
MNMEGEGGAGHALTPPPEPGLLLQKWIIPPWRPFSLHQVWPNRVQEVFIYGFHKIVKKSQSRKKRRVSKIRNVAINKIKIFYSFLKVY